MDLTDIPGDAYANNKSSPDPNASESPDVLLKSGSIRERLLNIDTVVRLRVPATASTVAERADCDTKQNETM